MFKFSANRNGKKRTVSRKKANNLTVNHKSPTPLRPSELRFTQISFLESFALKFANGSLADLVIRVKDPGIKVQAGTCRYRHVSITGSPIGPRDTNTHIDSASTTWTLL